MDQVIITTPRGTYECKRVPLYAATNSPPTIIRSNFKWIITFSQHNGAKGMVTIEENWAPTRLMQWIEGIDQAI